MASQGKIASDGIPENVSAERGSTESAPSPRRPKTERDNAFDFTVWLLEGLAGLSEELRHNDLGLPQDFWVHAYAARREALLAVRALVDVAIERCEAERSEKRRSEKKKPRKQRGPVEIDFG